MKYDSKLSLRLGFLDNLSAAPSPVIPITLQCLTLD